MLLNIPTYSLDDASSRNLAGLLVHKLMIRWTSEGIPGLESAGEGSCTMQYWMKRPGEGQWVV